MITDKFNSCGPQFLIGKMRMIIAFTLKQRELRMHPMLYKYLFIIKKTSNMGKSRIFLKKNNSGIIVVYLVQRREVNILRVLDH